MKQQFSRLDGPEHIRMRRSLAPQVSHARRLAELQPFIDEVVEEAVDRFVEVAPPVDLHTHFSNWVTSAVIAELIGVPPEERHLLHEAAAAVFRYDVKIEDARRALGPLYGYLYAQIRERRANPGDDVLSRMILHSAETDRPLSDDELVGMNSALLIAGFDTTASLLSHGLLALLDRRDDWDRLVSEPALADTAADEIVRYLGVAIGLLRQATEDTELGGEKIAAGDLVVAAVQSANRDTDLHPDADLFDIARQPGAHVGFGYGAHACVGRQIARMELSTMLRTLPRRVPSLRLARPLEETPFRTHSAVRGPTEVLVSWDEVLPRSSASVEEPSP
ncbi:cytochrome P450 [Micromonospora ureilytica]|uniref:cytochrome P450 n=1 Tax=Micromonospora ureilytica TaxID=709868 RepID=UPI0034084E2B